MPSSRITYVIAAFNAAETLEDALRSVFNNERQADTYLCEVVVVDDGGSDYPELVRIVSQYPSAKLLRHERNRGMCAARNTGIEAAGGDLIAILDADDRLVADWPRILGRVLSTWPPSARVCFTACINQFGQPTVEQPKYQGWYTFEDAISGRYSGEYMPIFQATYIKNKRYRDLGISKSCGLLSYLHLAQEAPFWICPEVLRIYTDNRAGSITNTWADPRRARESAICLEAVLTDFGGSYVLHNPSGLRDLQLKLAVYRRLARLRGAWNAWVSAVSPGSIGKSMLVAALLFIPPVVIVRVVNIARRFGLLRRYG